MKKPKCIIKEIPIELIDDNPNFNIPPHKDYGDQSKSIPDFEPLVVSYKEINKYQLLAGSRRKKDALKNGIKVVPCRIISELSSVLSSGMYIYEDALELLDEHMSAFSSRIGKNGLVVVEIKPSSKPNYYYCSLTTYSVVRTIVKPLEKKIYFLPFVNWVMILRIQDGRCFHVVMANYL